MILLIEASRFDKEFAFNEADHPETVRSPCSFTAGENIIFNYRWSWTRPRVTGKTLEKGIHSLWKAGCQTAYKVRPGKGWLKRQEVGRKGALPAS